MRKLWHNARKLAAHPRVHHSHHIAYVIYYAVAVFEERGTHAILGAIVLAFTCLAAIAADSE